MENIRRLRHLVAVADRASFSRAAEDLHISQPALSRSIASFEAHCGKRVFDRTGEGALPTAFGIPLIAQARRLLADAEQFDRQIARLADGHAGTAAFGGGPLVAALAFRDVLARLAQDRPLLEVEALIGDGPMLLGELRAGRIEFAVLAHDTFAAARDLAVREVARVHPAFITRSNHPLANRGALDMAQLAAFPLVSGQGASAHPALARAEGFITCNDFSLLRELVLGTDAVWLASVEMADRHDGLTVLDVQWDFGGAVPLLQATLAGRTMSPSAQAAAKLIAASLNDRADG